ncbi:anosmin-1 [Halyomorpha halys]|uniref:anosmin-1 n=1 Tax=Halyomorpha halys TaxID=286706 RepID=UPI0006D51E55|nr:anosmin-1 [Halyomorpha halys]
MYTLERLLFVAVVIPIFGESRNLFTIARCDSMCHQEGKECKEKCYSNPPEKPGQCGNQSYPFFKSCIEECHFNKDCPGLDLCCSNECGKTCQMPINLENTPGLPDIPTNVTVSKSPDLGTMLVDWVHPGDSMFVVEMKEASGPWQTAHKTPRLSHPIKIPIQSGVEYMARVAAVNGLGSKGFSNSSNPFTQHLEAKPPEMPENLSFKGVLKNGSVSGLFSWQLPRSDQHVTRYLVVWTQRIADDKTPLHKGSKEVHRKTIPHGKSCVRIKYLKPNALYTFHVQAQIIHDKTKISSKRATLNINTTNYTSNSHRIGSKQRSKQKIQVHYNILQKNGGLSAEISWKSRKKSKYEISWESICGKKRKVIITGSQYSITALDRNCEYVVVVKELSECKKRRRVGKVTFRTD